LTVDPGRPTIAVDDEGRRARAAVVVILQIVYLVLFAYIYMLLARFVMGFVLAFGRRWRPGRGAAAALEVVWSVTDPPLKALRRVIPPLRLGTVSLDLSSFLLLIILFVLLNFVVENAIDWAASPS
jgi:YggT family protein